ncbi:MAG: hypothetical protein WA139_05555 [Candidatus Aenigmatarchaeota archaeon]
MPKPEEFSRLLNFNPDVAVAAHGASIETIGILKNTGKIPSSDTRWKTNVGCTDYKLGCLYVVPRRKGSKGLSRETEHFAHLAAFRNYVADALPFKLQEEPSFYFDGLYSYHRLKENEKPPILVEVESHRMSENELEIIFKEARKRKGNIVYMSHKLLELPINYIWDDVAEVRAPFGLDAKYILGLAPLGNQERIIIKKWASEC